MRRPQTRLGQERRPPLHGGIDIRMTVYHAYVLNANRIAFILTVLAFTNIRAGHMQLYAMLAEATAQAAPTEVMVGCEATEPYWLSLYELLIVQG